ncbi:MAG: hypothetical protein QOJ93_3066 [Actinomycetota bacterium]|nr:hypothetical protein [Actinomycetota bacterium]
MMIIRRGPGELLAITQPDHARLAGALAEAWGDHAGPSLVAASHHHDDGWIAWEDVPTIDDQGRPHDLLTIPMNERVTVYRRGIELLATTDLYAGLLTSLHLGRLLAEGLGAVEGDARATAASFLAQQASWEEQARRELGDPAGVEADYHVLRTVDYLSLLLCMRALDELDGTPVTTMTMTVEDGRVTLHPYPFDVDEFGVSVPVRSLAATTFEDDEAYRSALRAAPVETLSWTLSRPRR